MEALIGLFGLAIWGGACVISIVLLVFWIWMIVDCAQNEPAEGNDKIVWLIIIIALNWIGAAIYYFVRRPQRPRPSV